MLEIEFHNKFPEGAYLQVNGFIDYGVKSFYRENADKTFVQIRNGNVKDSLTDSTFDEVGRFLDGFSFFYLNIKEWEFNIHLSVLCSDEVSGCIDATVFVNLHNWNRVYSPNDIRSVFGNLISDGFIDNAHIVPLEKNYFRSEPLLILRFYPQTKSKKIVNSINEIASKFEEYLHEVMQRVARRMNGFNLFVPKEIIIALKQYLIYFPEYVEVVKGRKINFEVKSVENGVFIEVGETDNLIEINMYFNEYLGFVKSNIHDLDPVFEVEISDNKKDLVLLNLRQQMFHLKQQLELKNFEVKVLEREVDRYYDLLTLQNMKPSSPINITTLSKVENKVDIAIDINFEMSKLLSDFLELKASITDDMPEIVKKEIEKIDVELLEANPKDVKSSVKAFQRIKRIFDQLSDEKSTFSKVVKGSKNLKDNLQKVGKAYNKMAQWMALPSIPSILLDV